MTELTEARLPTTEPKRLAEIARRTCNSFVLETVAANPSIPVDILVQLAQRAEGDLGGAVASNPSLPQRQLRDLAEDEDWLVRRGVACNPATPRDVLLELTMDEDEWVREAIADNPSVDDVVLKHLLVSTPRAVANPRIPEHFLRSPAVVDSGEDVTVLRKVRLANDPDAIS
jgi:hypothetical protein